jgi:hypothetical protein
MTMVELPRSAVDFKIDDLSDMALHMLLANSFADMKPHELFDIESAEELVDAGMLIPHGADESLPQLFTPTWQGAMASERLRCGIYHKHKALFEQRAARDAQLEAIPGYASF